MSRPADELDLFEQGREEPPEPSSGSATAAPAVPAAAGAASSGSRGREPEVWTVSQVNRAVRRLLEGTLPSLWVSGEIGGWTRARSGHRYFTLKDDRAQIRCVMFRTDAERLPTDPDDGMEVRVHGTLTLYEARGEYQLTVRRIEAAGAEGLWRLAFERLREKLDGEGLLAPERKRALPRFPETVGVVTSTSGAALRDILTVLARRAPWVRVVVRNARVQGEGAALEIADALEALATSGLADVVVVGRGGGSVEDLWAFNEEPVARAIAQSPVPVVSAVGHETDVTISDLVADVRAPTPSAAAETVVPDRLALADTLRRIRPRMVRALETGLRRRRRVLEGARPALAHALERITRPRRLRLDDASRAMHAALTGSVQRRRALLARAAAKLEALSPLSTLKRGYAVALAPDGAVLRQASDFEAGSRFVLRVVDGRVTCRTEQVEAAPASDGGLA